MNYILNLNYLFILMLFIHRQHLLQCIKDNCSTKRLLITRRNHCKANNAIQIKRYNVDISIIQTHIKSLERLKKSNMDTTICLLVANLIYITLLSFNIHVTKLVLIPHLLIVMVYLLEVKIDFPKGDIEL